MQMQDNFYEIDDEISFKDNGFMVAAAVTAYDGDPTDITDPSIGELKFYRKAWDNSFHEFGEPFKELEIVTCPDRVFNHDGENQSSRFYQT